MRHVYIEPVFACVRQSGDKGDRDRVWTLEIVCVRETECVVVFVHVFWCSCVRRIEWQSVTMCDTCCGSESVRQSKSVWFFVGMSVTLR